MSILVDYWRQSILHAFKMRTMPRPAARWLGSFHAPAIKCCGDELPEILEVGARDFKCQCSRCKKTWRVVDV